MKRWLWLFLAACTTAVTTTTITATTVELIPSSTVTVAAATSSTGPLPPVETSRPPVVTVVTVAPPLVTAVATTTTTRMPTIPTSPPITLAPEIAVVFSAPAEQLLTASTNLVRTSIGLPALIHHADLDFYARVWAGHLSRTGILDHSNIATLLGPWLIVGENVAAGTDMAQVANALASSPDHYATMVDPAYLHTGVGVAVDVEGRLWICQIFGGTVLP